MPVTASVTTPTKAKLAARAVVGRQLELEAIESAVDSARDSLVGISLEGEPGIGKTTLINATADLATERGFMPILAVADEEIRGPLLVARAIFDNAELRSGLSDATAEHVQRARSALRGNDESSLATMPADERLLRAFDLAAVALGEVSRERPVALLLDDLQWADQDSIRLIRYVIRANSSDAMYLMLTIRPEETAQVSEIVNLLADLERLGILRRMRVERLRQTETAQMLRSLLGGEPTPQTAATIHAQAEGVPYIVQELTRAYREAGLLQPIGGTWGLARHAERLVPSGVRTLIQRRAATLPPETRELLATGAVLGRAFAVDDLCSLRNRVDGTADCEPARAFEQLRPALAAGLISEVGEEGNRHLTFSHEQVRSFALDGLSPSQRQLIHRSIIELLTADGDPGPDTLPVLVRHALAAGDSGLIARYSLDAARAALASNAPEEALRVVDDALAFVSNPAQRVQLLCIRDDALHALGRHVERLEAMTELTALTEAVGDIDAEQEVQLRRAAALRDDRRHDAAADVARQLRSRAAAATDPTTELAASLELGQDLLRSPLGEGYTPTSGEADLDGAEEAFGRARDLAEQLGADTQLAQALRELGSIKVARIRDWFVERVMKQEHIPYLVRIANGESIQDMERELPIYGLQVEAEALLTRALELFEKVGDRRGTMSTIVSLAYLNWGPELHLGMNPAQRFEGIRQLATAMATLVQGSGREQAEGQMLYGAHVFARAKVIPDMAIERGEQAYQRARSRGDSNLEFLSAVGLVHVYLDLGDPDAAAAWLDRAAERAAAVPTPNRARQIAIASALIDGARGNSTQMVDGLRNAARMAAGQRRPAAQAEAVALLAVEAARLGAANDDQDLLEVAEASAAEARRLAEQLPGHPPWSAQADAAAARVALARGDQQSALELGRSALAKLWEANTEDPHFEVLLPAARAILVAGGPDEQGQVHGQLQITQAFGASRIMDEQVRMRWFRGPVGSELRELAGPIEFSGAGHAESTQRDLSESESNLLQLLVQGKSNSEIARELGVDESGVTSMLSALYARIGTSSRAETTAFAFRAV